MPSFSKLSFISLCTLPLFADQNLTLKSLDERLKNIEQKADAYKGVINLRSADTTMIIGGRIHVESIYLDPSSGKDGGINSSDEFFNANNIPLSSDQEGELMLTARSSRLWVKTRTATDEHKPLMTLLEVDFWGSGGNEKNSNSYGIRLRHAYFEYAGWTFGQTNSAFVGSGVPATRKAAVDDVLMRQPLIRYTKRAAKGAFFVSLEQPESVLLTNAGEKITVNDDRLPDLVTGYKYYERWGEVELTLLARELRIDETSEESCYGYGAHLSGKLKSFGNDDVRFSLLGGSGIGRYLGTSFFPGAVIETDGSLSPQNSFGGHLAYQHHWHRGIRSNLVIGYIETDNALSLDTLDKSASSIHVDLQYSPVANLLFACEYIHGKRTVENGDNGTLDRLYLHASYDF